MNYASRIPSGRNRPVSAGQTPERAWFGENCAGNVRSRLDSRWVPRDPIAADGGRVIGAATPPQPVSGECGAARRNGLALIGGADGISARNATGSWRNAGAEAESPARHFEIHKTTRSGAPQIPR
jgi:hypothetical protein